MQAVTGSPERSPEETSSPSMRNARNKWFVGGLFAGIALATSAGVAVLLVSGRIGEPRRADHAAVATLANIIARPLVPQGTPDPRMSDPEALAALSSRLDEADAAAKKNTELSPVAREFSDALRAMQALLAEEHSAQPLVRAGLETWRGSIDKDDGAFLRGLLGVGTELSKFGELSDRAKAIHARIVACRLRLAEIAARTAPPEATGDTATIQFQESRAFNSVANDTVLLKNVSGARLSQAMVVLELTGATGETFSNCFFADTWEPDQTLLAVCRSDNPGRETVHDVKRLRLRVIAAERSSRTVDLAF